jgi:hypothetical protein
MFGFCETSIENTIRIKQRRVANYQYRQNGPECWRNLSFRADDFVCITKLQIEMTTLEHQEHAIVLLDSTPNLANLDLINSYDDLADSVGVPVPRTPLARGPRRLKTLRLEKFDFANGSTEIARLVKLDELEDLQLIDCDGYPVLLRDLKILPLSLRASTMVEHYEEVDDQDFDFHSNQFLQSLKSPNRINLVINTHQHRAQIGMLDWSALETHASAIEYLRAEYQSGYLPNMPMFQTAKSTSDFARFCKSAVNLEQLAVSWVDIDPESWGCGAVGLEELPVLHVLVSYS